MKIKQADKKSVWVLHKFIVFNIHRVLQIQSYTRKTFTIVNTLLTDTVSLFLSSSLSHIHTAKCGVGASLLP